MHTNRLVNETSPYLLQHAHNPVDWYPWGPEALAKARNEDQPIFLSIGYAACHWCHVMEHESFENEEVAAILNREFVPVKVDREERPDLDEIYMTATMLYSGSGGWPMSVFLTPELKPFYGGTYWPPQSSRGMPGFDQILTAVIDAWKHRRAEANTAADQLAIELRTAKRIHGALHPYVGEEAVAVGVCAALDRGDRITSTHRGHGHCIAKGADINRMMAELFGRVDGYCKGKGGSMHIADFAIGMLGANGIVAGGMPIACGAALAAQLEDRGGVAACFFGDGATGEGEFQNGADGTVLVTRTFRTSSGFIECASCPHVQAERRFRWSDDQFTKVDEKITPTPYATFVRFIQSLRAADYESLIGPP